MSDQRSNGQVDTICGVERQLVERFLRLIRDNYPKADASALFLEEVAGTTHTLTMANLRDVLSHLATLLAEDTSPQDWEAHLACAAEHFRRAIQEPYGVALGDLRERFNVVQARYEQILPHIQKMQRQGLFNKAPTNQIIQGRLRTVATLVAAGRKAKRSNRINAEWDQGVASYAEAYDNLEKLSHELSSHIHEYEAIRQSHMSKFWSVAGMIGTIVFGIISLLLVLYPPLAERVQTWLGITH